MASFFKFCMFLYDSLIIRGLYSGHQKKPDVQRKIKRNNMKKIGMKKVALSRDRN